MATVVPQIYAYLTTCLQDASVTFKTFFLPRYELATSLLLSTGYFYFASKHAKFWTKFVAGTLKKYVQVF